MKTIAELLDFSVGSGGDSFESFFQTFGCLVLRHGRLFVKSLNREDQARRNRGGQPPGAIISGSINDND